jgi:hypothetical protein
MSMLDPRTEKKCLVDALDRTEGCLSPEDLGAYSEGRITGELRHQVEAHLQQCAYCRTELGLFEEFAAGAVRPGEELPVRWVTRELERRTGRPAQTQLDEGAPKRPWFSGWQLGPLVALAALLLVAVYLWNFRTSGPGRLQPSGDSGSEVLRSGAISLIAPGGDLTSIPSSFQWRAIAGATRYRVELMEVDATPLWTTEVAGSEVSIPAEVASLIVPAKTLLWRVEALDDRGAVIGRSDTQRFRLLAR